MSLKAFISTPVEDAQVARIRAASKGRVEVVHEPDLLPPPRYIAAIARLMDVGFGQSVSAFRARGGILCCLRRPL